MSFAGFDAGLADVLERLRAALAAEASPSS